MKKMRRLSHILPCGANKCLLPRLISKDFETASQAGHTGNTQTLGPLHVPGSFMSASKKYKRKPFGTSAENALISRKQSKAGRHSKSGAGTRQVSYGTKRFQTKSSSETARFKNTQNEQPQSQLHRQCLQSEQGIRLVSQGANTNY